MAFGDWSFNPFSRDKAREHYDNFTTKETGDVNEKAHGAPLSHEVIAGIAASGILHKYDKYKEAHGKEVKHATLKETLAGLAAAEAINIAEKHHQKLEKHERQALAVKAVQQTSHLAKELEEGRVERRPEYRTETVEREEEYRFR